MSYNTFLTLIYGSSMKISFIEWLLVAEGIAFLWLHWRISRDLYYLSLDVYRIESYCTDRLSRLEMAEVSRREVLKRRMSKKSTTDEDPQ